MVKLTAESKLAIQNDKSSLTTQQLQDKYKLSRSTIQRVKPNLDARVLEFRNDAPPPKETPNDIEKDKFVDDFVKSLDKGLDHSKQEVTIPVIPKPLLALDKNPIIQKILLNLDNFPLHYQNIDKASFLLSLGSKSSHDLQETLTAMELTRTTNNLSAQMKQVFLVGARAVEVVGSKIRLKTNGFADALLTQQQELDYIFKELAISYAGRFNQASSPEIRLGMLVGMTLLQIDSKNRIRELNTTENYTDL